MPDIIRLTPDDPHFPEALRHIPDPPTQLFIRGNLATLQTSPKLAIVGSRKVTPYGKQATTQFARECAERGIAIISGLAFGVDALAHEAALDVGGTTIAVLGSTVDEITPAANYQLGQRILQQGGALISEYPPGSQTHKHNFVERNRLVSGLADGVLITEAALGSGSLHTAAFALDQGKTVMAVPGAITSPFSAGTNNLLKTTALAVTAAQDVFLALGLSDTSQQTKLFSDDPAETRILNALEANVTDGADLLLLSKLDISSFNRALTMLEIKGRIYALGGNNWAIK